VLLLCCCPVAVVLTQQSAYLCSADTHCSCISLSLRPCATTELQLRCAAPVHLGRAASKWLTLGCQQHCFCTAALIMVQLQHAYLRPNTVILTSSSVYEVTQDVSHNKGVIALVLSSVAI
jgi:hypothetical protein